VTPQQRKAFDYIKGEIDGFGICPTLDQIAHFMGLKSKSNVSRIVDALIRDGYLLRGTTGARRNLRLAGDDLRQVATSALIAELERRGVRLG
jgi:SOS-response transcriptional repressor LexA